MYLERILTYAKSLLKMCTKPGDYVIDATVGNGNDTLFLANLVGDEGIVFGFDIQETAIINTKDLLNKNNKTNVRLIHAGHEFMIDYLPSDCKEKIAGIIFNLGYLPRGDKNIFTRSDTTIAAIKQGLEILKVNGMIVIVVYYGHTGGQEEKNDLLTFLSTLNQKNYQVLQYRFLNQKNAAPFVVAIEKIK